MKKISFILLLLASLSATAQKPQDSDTLLWNGRTYLVTVHTDVPSVVQVFYQRTFSELPFTFWSNTNSRGHLATFELLNDEIYLIRIEAKRFRTNSDDPWSESGIDTVVTPDYFKIHSLSADRSFSNDIVLADWFSGVLELTLLPRDKKERKSDEAHGHRLLLIHDGKVVNNAFISDKEYKLLAEKGQITDDKRFMLEMQRKFIDFYSRCAMEREPVTMNGHDGLFEHKPNSLSLVMEAFDNNPMRYRHEPDSIYGAPVGSWVLSGDSIFLVGISTHPGDSPQSIRRNVSACFIGFDLDIHIGDPIFAYWLNGSYVIHYGNWVTDAYGVRNYMVSKTQEIRVKDGVILSSKFSPRSFEDDEKALQADAFSLCNAADVWSVDDKQLAETFGKFKSPKKNPYYTGGKDALRNYLNRYPLTDSRAKERLFRVRIGFMVNCNGEAGQWHIINKTRGELNEFANMVLDVVKNMPQNWKPAVDKKGSNVDCWQVIEITVSNGDLSNADYK